MWVWAAFHSLRPIMLAIHDLVSMSIGGGNEDAKYQKPTWLRKINEKKKKNDNDRKKANSGKSENHIERTNLFDFLTFFHIYSNSCSHFRHFCCFVSSNRQMLPLILMILCMCKGYEWNKSIDDLVWWRWFKPTKKYWNYFFCHRSIAKIQCDLWNAHNNFYGASFLVLSFGHEWK